MTWRLLAVPLVAVLAGCASSSTVASSTPRPSAASAPRATASPAGGGTHSPEPSAEPVVKLAISCRLPVVTFTTGGDGISYQGGFVSFPGGTYAEDPNGLIVNRYAARNVVSKQTPTLSGVLGEDDMPFYDSATHRWVPAPASNAAPDGSSYAYALFGSSSADPGEIFVTNAADGTNKEFNVAIPAVGAPTGIQVMDYDGTGVYFVVTQFEQYPIGVWRLDVGTGKVTTLARTGAVMAIRNGYAWGGDVDPHDPNPPKVPASRTLFDEIGRVNLSTGAQSGWYYTPGRSEFLLGMSSAGWPIVDVGDAPDYPAYGGEVRLLPDPHTDGESNGELVSSGVAISNPETDGDRTWFGSDNGIYLYTSAGGLQKVFAFPPDQTTGKTMSPAGFCR